jgi:hypothetical protein
LVQQQDKAGNADNKRGRAVAEELRTIEQQTADQSR